MLNNIKIEVAIWLSQLFFVYLQYEKDIGKNYEKLYGFRTIKGSCRNLAT